MTDASIATIFASVTSISTVVMTAVMFSLKSKADAAAVVASDAKTAAQLVAAELKQTTVANTAKLEAIARVSDANHKLGNSATMALLIRVEGLCRRQYDRTKDIKDREALEEATRALKQHEEAQKSIDRDNPTGLQLAATPPPSPPTPYSGMTEEQLTRLIEALKTK